jgi:hypothetical protein
MRNSAWPSKSPQFNSSGCSFTPFRPQPPFAGRIVVHNLNK